MTRLPLRGSAALLVLCLCPGVARSQQDPPHRQCGAYEYWAGVELGWSTSAVHEGRCQLTNPQALNGWIRNLYGAANGVEGSNALCSERNPAWPGWYGQQDFLYQLADQAIASCGPGGGNVAPPCDCMSFWVKLNGTMAGWGNALGTMLADRTPQPTYESFGSCDMHYFKLGFRLAYAHQRLQEGDRNAADTQIRQAIQHVEMLKNTKPWSGYCVELWEPRFILPTLNRLLNRSQLSSQAAVDVIWHLMGDVANALNVGVPALGIRPCAGTPGPALSEHGRTFLAGNARGPQELANRPTVAVPPGTPSVAPPITPPGAPSPSPAPPVPPLPPPPPATPKPPAAYNLTGSWKLSRGGPDVSVITGGPMRYTASGTGANDVRNQATLVGDGTKFEGRASDLPGHCCGREGYVWLEVIDENTYRARSVWWKPGQGSKERPELTFGWSTWKRQSGALAPPPSSPARVQEDPTARKKVLGEELNRIRMAGRWVADHHYQVGIMMGNARTSAQLDATEALMRDYAACYGTKNAATDVILAAARAGRYPRPGARIGELNKVADAFNRCMEAAMSKWRAAPR